MLRIAAAAARSSSSRPPLRWRRRRLVRRSRPPPPRPRVTDGAAAPSRGFVMPVASISSMLSLSSSSPMSSSSFSSSWPWCVVTADIGGVRDDCLFGHCHELSRGSKNRYQSSDASVAESGDWMGASPSSSSASSSSSSSSSPFSSFGRDKGDRGETRAVANNDKDDGDDNVTNLSSSMPSPSPSPPPRANPRNSRTRERSIEERYSRKTPLEHILLRPGMYVGPTGPMPPAPCWVLLKSPPPSPPPPLPLPVATPSDAPSPSSSSSSSSSSSTLDLDNLRIVRREMSLIPALGKIFDEILVNASDNRLRQWQEQQQRRQKQWADGGDGSDGDRLPCTRIDVTIYPGCDDVENERDPIITITNDGGGIPVRVHSEEGLYVPELVFGHLLTGSNFDDDDGNINDGERNTGHDGGVHSKKGGRRPKQRIEARKGKGGGRGGGGINGGGGGGGGLIAGGRHGYGAKLTNIFSKEFAIETSDSDSGYRYRQIWRDNMSRVDEPVLEPIVKNPVRNGGNGGENEIPDGTDAGAGETAAMSKDYTRVTFVPDIPRLTGDASARVIPPDDYAYMCRRVVDVAGCSSVGPSWSSSLTVTLNGRPLILGEGGSGGVGKGDGGFLKYAHLYRSPRETDVGGSGGGGSSQNRRRSRRPRPLVYQKINPRWEVAVGLSETGSFESISFVNGMATTRGGTHVDVIERQIVEKILDTIGRDHPELVASGKGGGGGGTVTPALIRRKLCLFVNALVESPTFDSQMKECLTSNPDTFGSEYDLSDEFFNDLVREEGQEEEEEEGKERNDSGDDTDGTSNYDGGVGGGVGPGIIEEVIRVARGRQQAMLLTQVGGGKVTRRKVLSISKLDDAHLAGTDRASECSLILTEGDSAKALAVAGLEVIGRKRYGVFPLRGKFLNVRDASVAKLTANEEVKALCSILGLDFDKEYATSEERSTLRYGHVMLMTDQDADGSHIKGLLVNFFRHFWPCLLKPLSVPRSVSDGEEEEEEDRPFLSSFVTPLLKATRGKETKSFYSMAEFQDWRRSLPRKNDIRRWKVKYYKGLGTSTPAEAKSYFKEFGHHQRLFRWESDRDGNMLDMVFEKKRASDRRRWILGEYDETSPSVILSASDSDEEEGDVIGGGSDGGGDDDHHLHLGMNDDEYKDGDSVSYQEFIDHEMIHYSNANNVRSLPSVVDGLKPSQRKVLYACFKRNLKDEIKVAQLAGYCAEHTAYHHGEASLHATIIGMAQDFVGSNNINLLEPSGQFGTRLAGGQDAASPRYIFTRLSPIARLLFPEVDDILLPRKEDDGQIIEPTYYCPIIPLLVVNGAKGIGTGWSTFIPPHDPRDVVSYVRAKLDGYVVDGSSSAAAAAGGGGGSARARPAIRPWARGFTGDIHIKDDGRGYVSVGRVEKVSRTSVRISELPLGVWTSKYKEHLLSMRDDGVIQSFVEDHATDSVSFTVTAKSTRLERMIKTAGGLNKCFRLESNMLCSNMHAFDADNVIRRYRSAEDFADAHFPIRLRLYGERRRLLESQMSHAMAILSNRAEFITAVTTGKVDIARGRSSKESTVRMLEGLGFAKMSELDKLKKMRPMTTTNDFADSTFDGNTEEQVMKEDNGSDRITTYRDKNEFDYLLDMPLSSLTAEKIEALIADVEKTRMDLDAIRNKSAEDLWRDDLDKLEHHF